MMYPGSWIQLQYHLYNCTDGDAVLSRFGPVWMQFRLKWLPKQLLATMLLSKKSRQIAMPYNGNAVDKSCELEWVLKPVGISMFMRLWTEVDMVVSRRGPVRMWSQCSNYLYNNMHLWESSSFINCISTGWHYDLSTFLMITLLVAKGSYKGNSLILRCVPTGLHLDGTVSSYASQI
jgi:hypothetical protein